MLDRVRADWEVLTATALRPDEAADAVACFQFSRAMVKQKQKLNDLKSNQLTCTVSRLTDP